MNSFKLLNVSLALLSAIAFAGCGSSSDSNDDGDTKSGGISDGSYDCTADIYGGTLSFSATGKLKCSKDYADPVLVFVDGVEEIVTDDIVSVATIDTDIFTGTFTYDLKNKTEHISGTYAKYGAADCTNTYDVNLPLTIYDPSELEGFNFGFGNYQRVSSTCPDWVNIVNGGEYPMTTDIKTETTVKDDTGAVSKVLTHVVTKIQ